MFNQQEYINSFIKNNYRTIKIRIRNTDKVLINKINSVDNINKYILGLISDDIRKNRKYNYIDDSIDINFDLSKTMRNLVEMAEEADLLEDYGMYMNVVDAIDSQAKKETSKHIISEIEWKQLIRRYCL